MTIPNATHPNPKPSRPHPRVFFATRSGDWRVHAAYADCLVRTAALFREEGIPCAVQILNGGNINLAQNRLVARFLASGANVFFSLDADMAWEPESAVRLVRHLAHDGVSVVGCNYPKRERAAKPKFDVPVPLIPGPVSVNWILRNGRIPRHAATGLLEVTSVMGGFTAITRAAIERLIAVHAPPGIAPGQPIAPGGPITRRLRIREGREDVVMLFESEIDEGGGPSDENPTFCRRWRALGEPVWLDPWGHFEHLGPASYAGPSVADSMSLPGPGAGQDLPPIVIDYPPAPPTPPAHVDAEGEPT